MAVSCPNCKIPCTGCAGARITVASDGVTVCTKCFGAYENALKLKLGAPGTAPSAVKVKYNPGRP